jgi:hypothetical protein
MIGDSFTVSQDPSTPWGDLPQNVSDDVVLSKVNQDNFGAEYRFTGTDGRYILRIRNSTEPQTANRALTNRHNIELTYVSNGDPLNGVPERTYVVYIIARFPPGGDMDTARAIFEACTRSLSAAQLTKIMNFES